NGTFPYLQNELNVAFKYYKDKFQVVADEIKNSNVAMPKLTSFDKSICDARKKNCETVCAIFETGPITLEEFYLELPSLEGLHVSDLKRSLHENHPFKPDPQNQRIIYKGQILANDLLLENVFPPLALKEWIHLLIESKNIPEPYRLQNFVNDIRESKDTLGILKQTFETPIIIKIRRGHIRRMTLPRLPANVINLNRFEENPDHHPLQNTISHGFVCVVNFFKSFIPTVDPRNLDGPDEAAPER
ncbi:hypothetical protein ROZALSC1DRAFT_23195, partial [Rozella allomycis CSF55]